MLGDLRTRLRLFPVIAISVLLVYWLVWPVAKPNIFNDPLSFIYNQTPGLSWILLLAVASVSTVLTVLICRRRLPDLPVLVFAAGLCVLSVRGGDAVRAHWSYGARASYLSFAVETLLLSIVLYLVHLLGKLLLARLIPRENSSAHPHRQFSLASALQSLGLAVLVALIVTLLVAAPVKTTIAGARIYSVYDAQRAQIIFAALAAGFLSTLAAHQSFRPARSLFCWLSLPLVAMAAYLFLSVFSATANEALPTNPLGNFLPIDFIGPGVLGGMLGLLLSHKLFRNRAEEEA